MKKPLVLCIMDGFAFGDNYRGNAIKNSNTKNLNEIFSSYPTTTLHASGNFVGLPDGQMGNSEVGHTNIGAGRVVYQELTRITKSINDGDFFENPVLVDTILKAKSSNTALHIIGLLSDGGVHSHIDHCFAILKLCKNLSFENVYIHPFLDGRDVSPVSGQQYVQNLINYMDTIGIGKIGTIHGRFYAMDRDNRWERTGATYDALVYNKGDIHLNAVDEIKLNYQNNITDEFIKPFIVTENSNIKMNDSVIFFNFRPDRARQLTRSLVDVDFDGFERNENNLLLNFTCMTQYDASMPKVEIAFKGQNLTNVFGEYIAKQGLTQLRIAETEKYAHVTFFFNGGVEAANENEDRILIPSPKVATYDLKPEMSAYELTSTLLEKLDENIYDVVIVNYANCDMVGHTGNIPAAIKAVETVDECIGLLKDKILKLDGVLLITADHGNADKMLDDADNVFTAHTTNPVPFSVVNYPCKLKDDMALCDISPTMLEILNLSKPIQMSGNSIIKK